MSGSSFHQVILRYVFMCLIPRDVTNTRAWPWPTARWCLPSHLCLWPSTVGDVAQIRWSRQSVLGRNSSIFAHVYTAAATSRHLLMFYFHCSPVWLEVSSLCPVYTSLCSFQDISSPSMMLIIKNTLVWVTFESADLSSFVLIVWVTCHPKLVTEKKKHLQLGDKPSCTLRRLTDLVIINILNAINKYSIRSIFSISRGDLILVYKIQK